MLICINKSKKIISEESRSSISSRFTWGEGNVETETIRTTYNARLILRFYCDNPSIYIKIGGKEGDVAVESQPTSFINDQGQDLYETIKNREALSYAGIKVTSFNKETSHTSFYNPINEYEEFITFEEASKFNDKVNLFNYRIIRIINSYDALVLMRTVTIQYSYTREYSY